MLLSSMRNGFFSALFLGLLVLGAAGLMVSDWNGLLHNGVTKTDVATVDGHPIKINEFNAKLSRILNAQNIDVQTAYKMGYINQILESVILDKVLQKSSLDLGIRVSDEFVATQIKNMITPLAQKGMSDKEALAAYLNYQRISEKQLVEESRNEMATSILRSTLTSASYVPKALLNDFTAYKNETRNIEFVMLPNATTPHAKTPTDAELEAYYKDHQSEYMLPEKRDFTVAILDTTKISSSIQVSEEDVASYYAENKKSFELSEMRAVEQAQVDKEDSAKKILDLAKSGKPLKDAVTEVMGSDKNFIAGQDFAKDGLMPQISTPVFAAKEGEFLGPIQSPLGWHVLYISKISPAHLAALDEVKAKIEASIREEKAADEIFNVTSKIEDSLTAGTRYEDLLKEYDLKLITLNDQILSEPDSKIIEFAGDNTIKLVQKAFAGVESEATPFADGKSPFLYSVRADKVVPSTPKTFDEVKEDLSKKWIEAKKIEQNIAEAEKNFADLNDGKIQISSLREKPQTANAVPRYGDSPLAEEARSRFFDAPVGKYILVASPSKDAVYIGRVTGVSIGNGEAKADESFVKQIQNDAQNMNLVLFLQDQQKKYSVETNPTIIKRAYGTSPEGEE